MTKPWLEQYQDGVPHQIDPATYASVPALLEDCCTKQGSNIAFVSFGVEMSYAEWNAQATNFAAYLQSLGLAPGDRVAVMLPNVIQSPVAVFGILKAGMVVVNVNPLYTAGELRHQLTDSGAKAILILENFAATLQSILPETPVEHTIVTTMGDQLGLAKGLIVNFVVRHRKKLVPPFSIKGAVRFKTAQRIGARHGFNPIAPISADAIAVLQYTGGTTGVAAGAILQHRALIAALMLAAAWVEPMWIQPGRTSQNVVLCALPLFHIFAFVHCALLGAHLGGRIVLIPNARDIPALIGAIKKEKIDYLPAVDTLFAALARNADFRQLDHSNLRISVGGGMAVNEATAARWLEVTGCHIAEGYGLTETSSAVACNPLNSTTFSGSVGLPLPSCDIRIVDDNHQEVGNGESGEVAVAGPSVMAGYWQNDERSKTAKTADGYFLTGDIGRMDDRGYLHIVDRLKDMILVSGFNVYPAEIEACVNQIPGVLESAAIGVKNTATGETVRLFVSPAPDHPVSEEEIRAHCRAELAWYKRPRNIVFVETLPKTNVGKILRRALRELT